MAPTSLASSIIPSPIGRTHRRPGSPVQSVTTVVVARGARPSPEGEIA